MKKSGKMSMVIPGLVVFAMLGLTLQSLGVDLGAVGPIVEQWWPATLLLAYGKKLMCCCCGK